MITRPAVLVTGGARRIGAAIAAAFAAAGWHVVIHYGSSQDEAERLASSFASAGTIGADLADPGAATALVAALSQDLADLRVLVNCASVFELDTADQLDPAVFDRALRVNAAAPALLAQAFLAQPRSESGRRVINVTDQKIANPNPDFFSYTMSKHALAAIVPMLAMAATDPRDRVYGLAPGAILASHDQQEAEIERSHRMNLLERKTGADEIAAAALFLAEGWLASGETLFIDSGQHLLAQPRDVLFLAREESA
jgi:NAD(P)-dependent dehydrogenase (short-subunit alcohol dehydrogenase family)